ncbi:uncharacterized protein LOC141628691 [Silene latifolia]|uniref:uncharacterized protein LOC141628691 n=1 Tax=Silene latifolia TaxID=37657 RepID=UPI003D77A24C
MFRLVSKLKSLKSGLKQLNKEQFSDIENLTSVAELSLKQFQESLALDPLNEQLMQNERACAHEVSELRKARAQFLSQKAKCDWIKLGDENTSYFHARIKRRRARNIVFQVRDINNNLCSSPESIQQAFEEYYKSLLGTSKQVRGVNRRVVTSGKCVTDAHCSFFTAPITSEEVKQAMFDIPGDKAPGPDGYSSHLFKENWDIVGPNIVAAVKGAFSSGKLLKQVNNTIITLIPKVELPETVVQFSPIACCNTVYKCLSKWSFVRYMLTCLGFPERFLRGDRASSELLLRAFNHFSNASGLIMNRGKSNFYYNGVEEAVINNIVEKIRGFGARKLSYAGRMVLIKVVLSNLHSYWARIFILPKAVIKKIEAVCRDTCGMEDYEHGNGTSWAWRKICQVKNIYKPNLFSTNTVEHYSIKDGYQWLIPERATVSWYPWMLNKWILPKHGFMVWLVAQKRFLTQDRLVKMNIIHVNCCFLCGDAEESHSHLFFDCCYSRSCLQLISDWCLMHLPVTDCIQWWVKWKIPELSRKKIIVVIIASLMAHIWFSRNKCRIDECVIRPAVLCRMVKLEVKNRLASCDIKSRNRHVLDWLLYIQST